MPDLLRTHVELLERWRQSMNLIGPGPVSEHVEDCDRALAGLRPEGHWVDLGSGAGFPGLVLAARWPELRVDLVDSRRKRCVFLEQVLGTAGVPPERVRVVQARVEDVPGPYDGVVARAFAPPEEVLAHADRLLRPGGLCVLFLQADADVPLPAGFEVFHVEPYRLGDKARRALTVRRKAHPARTTEAS